MDRLIHDLYTKNIIEIKKTKLKNGLTVPFYFNLLKIFEYPTILELFLSEFYNFIVIVKLIIIAFMVRMIYVKIFVH